MKKICIIACLLPVSLAGQTIKKALDELVCKADTHIGIKVVSLGTQKCLYEHNPSKLFVPASILKLFTATAALYLLGSHFTFETSFCTNGVVNNNCLYGNLYLRGSGDPTFCYKQIEKLVLKLKDCGISHVQGDLVIDDSEFDEIHFGPGWMWDEGSVLFNSPISALNLNHNCVKVTVVSESTSERPLVRVEPAPSFMNVINNAQTSNSGSLSCRRTKGDEIEVTGALSENTQSFQITVKNPREYTAHTLNHLFAKHTIELHGTTITGKTPEGVSVLALHQTPLKEVAWGTLKHSDNLYAECLCKKLASIIKKQQGTWAQGCTVIKEFLATHVGLDPKTYKIVDGSGVSRYNLLAADQVVQLLTWLHASPLGTEIISLLPAAGEIGSLKERLPGHALYAKTGTMTGITSLAGYLRTQSNDLLAFSILINGFVGPQNKYKALEDAICTLLIAYC